MTSLQRTLDLLNEHAPPAPPAIFAELRSIDFASLTASEFETLVSIVLRARADCIVAVSAGPELRRAYANVLPDVASLMRTSFAMRPDDVESIRFFEKFAESVRELNACFPSSTTDFEGYIYGATRAVDGVISIA